MLFRSIKFEQLFNISEWKEYTKERQFNINGDSVVGILPNQELTVKSTEKYLIAIPSYDNASSSYDDSADKGPDGLGEAPGMTFCQTNFGSPGGKGLLNSNGERLRETVRVGNLLPMSNVNDIEVMIKRIPRQLRGVDLLATIYRYGAKGLFRQASSGSPRIPLDIDNIGMGGAINNSLYCWICLQKQLDGTLAYTELPDFFKWQNETIFRSFYGSVDKIENKIGGLASQFPWELIPYEYGTK